MQSKLNGVFITGTDTGVGKTFYSRSLLQRLNLQGLRTAAMKPLASGGEIHAGELRNADALLLKNAASTSFAYRLCNPYCFQPAIAPHLAAKQAGINIDLNVILDAYQELQQRADITVIEGVGGWLVPIDDNHTLADLVKAMDLPVILVVGMRLGCINHALLTTEDITKRGIRLLGWVANVIDPAMSCLQENIDSIAQRMPAPLLDIIEFTNNLKIDEPNPDLSITWLEY